MGMKNTPAPLILVPGSPAWLVVMEAMDQFVQNHGEYAELVVDDMHEEDAKKAQVTETQRVAEDVMEHFTKVFCDLADR